MTPHDKILVALLFFCTSLVMSSACIAQDNCLRSEPEPYFAHKDKRSAKNQQISQHQFTLLDASSAIETFDLADGTHVKIEHTGCEYFVNHISISAAWTARHTPSHREILQRFSQRLRQLHKLHPNTLFEIRHAADQLARYPHKAAKVTFPSEPISLDKPSHQAKSGEAMESPRAFFTIEQITYRANEIALRLSLTIGPL
ncbi:hypothetical protein RF679_18540 [Undibacterium cyanobacteriorum]|uniref:Uncharacterized protein n=1 Tax=Undibacterium cyanobacteriorum TaxID=3073561 RepID=A0ABY9RHC8_9BURK|nr:hypothetical protein [Undibacterium sp. 20NA77.5]WMW80615.1 hypothetical protein RF679_18540 [Undibacterium sp. 20NA77.5]